MVLGTAISVIVQAGIGMDVNLFVAIPSHHSGAQPADFFTGSLSSVLWAVTHGGLALAVHTLLGIVLIVMVIAVVVRAARLRRRASTIWSALVSRFRRTFHIPARPTPIVSGDLNE